MNSATRDYLLSHRHQSAATVAAALAADLTTARNILTDELSGYLTGTGIFGPFLTYKAGTMPPQLEVFRLAFANLDFILTNLRGRVVNGELEGGYTRTTDPGIAAQMDQMIAGFKQAGLLTDPEATGFITQLAGGYRYDRLTAEQITAAWVDEDAREAESLLRQRLAGGYNACVNAVDEGERDPAVLVAVFAATLEG